MTEREKQIEKREAGDMNRDPITGAPGAHPVGTGIGAAGGAVAGATIGSIGGPVGTAVGGVVGSIVGGLAGKSVGEAMNPAGEEEASTDGGAAGSVAATPLIDGVDPVEEDLYWQRTFITEPYYNSALDYDDYAPAYRIGMMDRLNNKERSWEESEVALQSEWERSKGTSRLGWDDAK